MSTRVNEQQLSDEDLRVRAVHDSIAAEVAAAEPQPWTHRTPIWRELGENTMKLFREYEKLAKEDQKPEHREAMRLKVRWYRDHPRVPVPAAPAVVAPAVVAPAVVAPAQIEQPELADEEEVFNFNWRPASRRSNLTISITVSF
jgi:hypothetical protein